MITKRYTNIIYGVNILKFDIIISEQENFYEKQMKLLFFLPSLLFLIFSLNECHHRRHDITQERSIAVFYVIKYDTIRIMDTFYMQAHNQSIKMEDSYIYILFSRLMLIYYMRLFYTCSFHACMSLLVIYHFYDSEKPFYKI